MAVRITGSDVLKLAAHVDTRLGASTHIIVMKRLQNSVTAAGSLGFTLRTAADVSLNGYNLDANITTNLVSMGGGSHPAAFSATMADGWMALAVTKLSGLQSMIYKKYVYGTGAFTTSTGPGVENNTAVTGVGGTLNLVATGDGDVAIAAVAMYNTVLSDEQIQTAVQSLSALKASNPVWGLWVFNNSVTSAEEFMFGSTLVSGSATSMEGDGDPFSYGHPVLFELPPTDPLVPTALDTIVDNPRVNDFDTIVDNPRDNNDFDAIVFQPQTLVAPPRFIALTQAVVAIPRVLPDTAHNIVAGITTGVHLSLNTSWDVAAPPLARAATGQWKVAAAVSATASAGWGVEGGTTEVDATSGASWAVQVHVVDQAAGGWATRALAVTVAAGEWVAATVVAAVVGSEWNAHVTVTQQVLGRWAIPDVASSVAVARWGALSAVASPAVTGWQVATTAVTFAGASWATLGLADADVAASWAVRSAIVTPSSAHWGVHASAQALAEGTWQLMAPLSSGAGTEWAVQAFAGSAAAGEWQTLMLVRRTGSFGEGTFGEGGFGYSYAIIATFEWAVRALAVAPAEGYWDEDGALGSRGETGWSVRELLDGSATARWAISIEAEPQLAQAAWDDLLLAERHASGAWDAELALVAQAIATWDLALTIACLASCRWKIRKPKVDPQAYVQLVVEDLIVEIVEGPRVVVVPDLALVLVS